MLGGGLDAVDARHLHVHEDDVGAQLAGQLDGLGAVPGLADDLDVGLDGQDQPEARSGPAPGRRPAALATAQSRALLGPERQPDPHPVAAGRPRTDLDLAAVGGGALADAELPEARAGGAVAQPPVVQHLDLGERPSAPASVTRSVTEALDAVEWRTTLASASCAVR